MISRLGTLDWHRFLGRPRLPSPTLDVLDAIYQQSLLITGAGGSIGAALAQRLSSLGPSGLVLLDSSESRLYKLQQIWIEEGLPGPMSAVLGDVSHRTLLDELFHRHKPLVVFHAAAFKHVPLLEQQPLAAILNNVFGTLMASRAAAAHNARFVLLSTDKAVEPASIMGATKRLAEKIVLAAGGVVLRLGNVLATRDSVTETFAKQLAQDVPLTITDPAARRFFLTLDEAVNLLLTAASEPGAPTEIGAPALLAPALPPPQFITDLAHFMAAELTPGRTPAIDFIGFRPGDKECETFWSSTETPQPAAHAGLLRIDSSSAPDGQLNAGLAALRTATEVRDLPGAIDILCTLIPEYTPGNELLALAGHRVNR